MFIILISTVTADISRVGNILSSVAVLERLEIMVYKKDLIIKIKSLRMNNVDYINSSVRFYELNANESSFSV